MIKYVDYIRHSITTPSGESAEADRQTDALNNCIHHILELTEGLQKVSKAYRDPEDAPGYLDMMQGQMLLETITGNDLESLLTLREGI